MSVIASPSAPRGLPPWIIALGAFMAIVFGANGILIWLSSHGRHDLVRADYYDAGLQQDSLIARSAPAGSMGLRRENGDWVVDAEGKAIEATACKLHFYRPDDGRADMEIHLRPGAGDQFSWRATAPDAKRGKWIVTAVWESKGAIVRESSSEYFAGE